MMNLNEYKNDTTRKKAIREYLCEVLYNAVVTEFGEENVLAIPKSICVGENGAKIAGGSIAVRVGTVKNKDGFEVDAVAIINATIKNWNDVCTKSDKVILAVNMDDIAEALDEEG